MNRRAMFPFARAIALVLAPALLAACSAQPAEEPPLAGAKIGGEFTLVDKTGKQVRWSQFDGSWRTIYFGYTFCPDACPMDMSVLMKGFRLFEQAHPDRAAKVQPLFVSIDPARDGPQQVGEFAAAFHPRLIGLTGSTDAVRNAADAYRVYYKRVTTGSRPDDYTVDHSAFIYLMDRDGKYLTFFPPGTDAAKIVGMVRAYLRGGAER